MSGADSLVSINDFNTEQIRRSLELVADVLDGGVAVATRCEFRMLLSGFGVNRDQLTAEHRTQLDGLIAVGRQFRALRIIDIVGRASATGNEPNNVVLSQGRAAAASSYLLLGGVSADRTGEVRGVGSADPILDVGPAEEPFNRSVEIAWSFEHIPVLDEFNPTVRWIVNFGPDTAWAFSGSQRLSITRVDTGEVRHGTFTYVDAAISIGPGRFYKWFSDKGHVSGGLDEFVLKNAIEHLPERWQRWLTEAIMESVGTLSVLAADDEAVPMTRGNPLTWEMFDGALTYLIEPPGISSPVGEQTIMATTLVFGFPVPFAAATKWFDNSVGLVSLFPEISTGAKVGWFQFD